MISSPSQIGQLSTIDTALSSLIRKVQSWVRHEIIDEDPYDDAALLEEALLAELMKSDPTHIQNQIVDSYRTDEEYRETSSILRQNLQTIGFL
ncbi:hypothetical protein C1752_09167 [Acaryochloris thomasi RCC1774]|uniref:Uncharacterized protein n=1 Tax=Acaryochloris thomasi RCC1774 TaxID=1764569 RepID=A0A2W1J948_9CYAN|nr:hypothetical protein [Acaryochloris thomasi]PZD70790.1 hypothetical protein C1752_09167 [Acaryochloris thomasi RCC1774]